MAAMKHICIVLSLAATFPGHAFAAGPTDLFMGEYSGEKGKADAKVAAEGDGWYRAVLSTGEGRVELRGRAAAKGVVLGTAPNDGCVTAWEVSGPYRQEGKGGGELFDVAFPPEQGDGSVAEWKSLAGGGSRPCVVDLLSAVGGEDCVVYLRAHFESSAEQEAWLLLGSSNSIKAWFNGTQVHSLETMRVCELGQDQDRVLLARGRNVLMLKLTQDGCAWEASAAVNPDVPGIVTGVPGRGEAGVAWTATIQGGVLRASPVAGKAGSVKLKKVRRKSPTLGKRPPRGAVVLLPITGGKPSLAEWENKAWKTLPGGVMVAGDGDNRTRRQFGDVNLHVEFRVPYQPGNWRDRGNSGVYLQDRYEVQILETFGLEPDAGIGGAIYRLSSPKVNAALPPLEWQTFDITFTAPRFKTDGTVEGPGKISVLHNGILIHDGVEVLDQTGGGPEGAVRKGPIRLQDHGHPVEFRNIWVVDLESGKKGSR